MKKRTLAKRAICFCMIAFMVVGSAGIFFAGCVIKRVTIPPSDEYNIYMHFGTLPTLYAAAHVFSHTTPSYIYFSRKNTFDMDKMPAHVQLFARNEANNNNIIGAAKDLIRDINKEYPKAVFHFYVDDFRLMAAYYALLTNGIPESRFDITIFSDGGGTYGAALTRNYADSFHYTMSINGEMEYFEPKQNGFLNWQQAKKDFEDILADFKARPNVSRDGGNLLYGDGSGTHLIDKGKYPLPSDAPLHDANSFGCDRYAFIAAQRPNVRYWMQFPEYIWMRDDIGFEVRSQLLRATLSKVAPVDIVEALTPINREAFFNAVINNPENQVAGEPVDRELLDSLLLNTAKPPLIISGANLGAGAINYFGHGANYFPDVIIEQIKADFGAEYTLFFKPHPSFTADNNKIKNKGITVLPAQLPMDVLLWAYPDIAIGGYNSSLYMSVRDSNQVKFFIERIGEEGHLDNILFVLEQNGFYQSVSQKYCLHEGSNP